MNKGYKTEKAAAEMCITAAKFVSSSLDSSADPGMTPLQLSLYC